jgi:GNAT superfamily N-acetyltransferase
MTIERATAADLPEVLALLNGAAAWLHSRGLDQWPHGFTVGRIGPMIARREVWIARDGGRPVGTVTISGEADLDFWTAAESREPAVYVSKLAVSRADAGAGLGALLLRWAVDYAARIGCDWARLDAWRTNDQLHAYYRRQGWEQMRIVRLPHRRSGALFQRPAVPDLEAREAFTVAGALALPERRKPSPRPTGVMVTVWLYRPAPLPSRPAGQEAAGPASPGDPHPRCTRTRSGRRTCHRLGGHSRCHRSEGMPAIVPSLPPRSRSTHVRRAARYSCRYRTG